LGYKHDKTEHKRFSSFSGGGIGVKHVAGGPGKEAAGSFQEGRNRGGPHLDVKRGSLHH